MLVVVVGSSIVEHATASAEVSYFEFVTNFEHNVIALHGIWLCHADRKVSNLELVPFDLKPYWMGKWHFGAPSNNIKLLLRLSPCSDCEIIIEFDFRFLEVSLLHNSRNKSQQPTI